MKASLYINGKDAWNTWGAGLLAGSYNNLLAPPPMKEYVANNARSQDGSQIFVSNARISEREVILMFGIEAKSLDDYLNKYSSLLDELMNGVISLYVPDLKTKYNLLYISSVELNTANDKQAGTISIRFTEPNPKNRIQL